MVNGWQNDVKKKTRSGNHSITGGRLSQTAAKWICATKSWHHASSPPGNKLPVHYPTSLRDAWRLSHVGATESRPVIYCRATIEARSDLHLEFRDSFFQPPPEY